jgi:fibro-slime domain-containing protein
VLAAATLAMLAGTARSQTTPSSFTLVGIARDFRPTQSDFAVGATDNSAMSAGNIAMQTDAMGLPVYQGGGHVVSQSATDVQGRGIAPHMASTGGSGAPVTEFEISSNSRISSSQAMAAKITVVGAAITAGGAYDCPVTTRINVESSTFEPFGSFAGAMSGNVNNGISGVAHVLPVMIQPGQEITIDGRSWLRVDSDVASSQDSGYRELMTANSADGSQQLHALRNGDSVPEVPGFMGQASVEVMLRDYIDAERKVKLADNQIIYLFELGTTDKGSSAFDMQDLVVLVDLATDPSYWDETPTSTPPCVTIDDSPADLGASSTGTIASQQSFAQWFNAAPGVNASIKTSITLSRDPDGVFVYESADFTPVDGKLYGNDGGDHNRGFTYMIDASAVYAQCGRQFVTFQGEGDVWMFVNGKLVMDMGGSHPTASQTVDMDRLELTGGETARIQLFYAQRGSGAAPFTLRTNMAMTSNITNVAQPGVSGLWD